MTKISEVIADLMEILATEGDIRIFLTDDKARLSILRRMDIYSQNIYMGPVGTSKQEPAILLRVE